MRDSLEKFETLEGGTTNDPASFVLIILSTILALMVVILIWRLLEARKRFDNQASLSNEREKDILAQIATWEAIYQKREADFLDQIRRWQASYNVIYQESFAAQKRYENHLNSGMLGLEQMRNLPPDIFEETIAYNMRLKGYRNVRLSGGSGDLGADISGIDTSERRVIVQCKRYSSSYKIGTPELTHFLGAKNIHGADRLIFVTTSSFTSPAKQLASAHGIELLEGTDIEWRLRVLPIGF